MRSLPYVRSSHILSIPRRSLISLVRFDWFFFKRITVPTSSLCIPAATSQPPQRSAVVVCWIGTFVFVPWHWPPCGRQCSRLAPMPSARRRSCSFMSMLALFKWRRTSNVPAVCPSHTSRQSYNAVIASTAVSCVSSLPPLDQACSLIQQLGDHVTLESLWQED